MANGLFHKAVAESFNPIDYKTLTLREAEQRGKEQFKQLTLQDMRSLSADEVMRLGNDFQPIIDGSVIEEQYDASILSGKTNHIPMLTGFVTGDPLLFANIKADKHGKYVFEKVLQQAESLFHEHVKEFLELYDIANDTKHAVETYQIDQMQALIDILAKVRNTHNDVTYSYLFTHVMPGENSDVYGAFHTADVPYFLGLLSNDRKEYWTEGDRKLANQMAANLIAFATTGNPNVDGQPEWVTNTKGQYMVLDTQCRLDELSQEKQEFFQKIYSDLLKN